MSYIVVKITRDRWFWPVLKVTTVTEKPSEESAKQYITEYIMAIYERRINSKIKMGPYSRVYVPELRTVTREGLKRLQAAAKASVTVRRRRAAAKAAKTRAARAARIQCESRCDLG
jgi:hypothetical protein